MTHSDTPDLSDIKQNEWVDRWFTPAITPYLRLAWLNRPVGIWLMIFPCVAALFQASHGWPGFRGSSYFLLVCISDEKCRLYRKRHCGS